MTEVNYGNSPSADELRTMSPEEAMIAGAEVDGVHIVHRRERFPVRGSQAEKRAERAVAACFGIAGLAGVGFIVAFIAVPFHWHLPGTPQTFKWFTPAVGGTLALMLFFFGLGLVLWGKWLMPEEEVIQDRHDDPSKVEDQMMTEATLVVGLEDTGIRRRSLLLLSVLGAGGALATVPLVYLVGSLLKRPGTKLFHTMYQPNTKLFPQSKGMVPIVYNDWRQVSPDDLLPGGLATVFPGVRVPSEGYDGVHNASSPTLLIRLRPGQVVHPRKGQGDFGWPKQNPQYVAFSKICTHAGCPASLYEQQTGRLLCPCHQSQFDVLSDAKPVFGPATRSLPKLPLEALQGKDGRLYFYARSDYHEPIGPSFWERP